MKLANLLRLDARRRVDSITESQPDLRIRTLKMWIAGYRSHLERSLEQFPEKNVVSLEGLPPDERPLVRLFLPPHAVLDRYAPSFERRLLLLGQSVERTSVPLSGDRILLVDIRERSGRDPNQIPGALEIPQAAVWLGLDYFVHLRANSIRKTLQHCDRLLDIANTFSDKLSETTALALICDQLTGIPLELPPLSLPYDTQYFGTDLFELAPDEIVIDAGAAFGDSLIKFAKRQSSFTKWYAFDPDPHLASELSKFVEREYPDGRAVAISTPLAEKSEEVSMIFLPGTGNTRVNRSGTNTLQASSIDDYIKGDRVSIIKMDVEGSELALLRGARDSIRRYKPKLLISCYHEVEHLFQIPELISEFRPDYRFYLRNHTWATEKDSWPSSFFCESVIYAL